MAPDFVVVLPTLNEREGLAKTLDELISAGVPPGRILVVDGGSTDGTCQEAEKRGVRCILQEGRGKADAVRTALKVVDAPAVVIMDADFTYPAARIWDLVSLLDKCDEVIGARLRPEPGAQRRIFKLGNWLLTKFFNLIFDTRLSDVLSGMYAVKTEALEGLEKASRGFGIESEIAAHVASTGGEICEVPIEYRRRVGQKKLGIKHGILIALDMLRLGLRYNPTFFIFLAASLLAIPGFAIAGWVAYRWVVIGVKHYVWGIIGTTLASVGTLSAVMALLALYLKRMEIRILKQIRRAHKSRTP
ncbi:Glycosyltransferases involved in cell wall biogenesis [Pyrobaculum oguniense TE7]|uniref:Glycosyltransferases involved in cell wall biogenesis n=1 Tax=Pyrobaculum oguniense (strain DSM 13380 / JCM 10595 / TE7) TaxID=698757 RepID=H6QB73_PYROT|nr:Glycosyltransferases involved in cell wall biogenesis [Pyrobaculum oguniense TE7]